MSHDATVGSERPIGEVLAEIAAQAGPAGERLKAATTAEAKVLRDFAAVCEQVKTTDSAEMSQWGAHFAAALARSVADTVEAHIVPLSVVANDRQGGA